MNEDSATAMRRAHLFDGYKARRAAVGLINVSFPRSLPASFLRTTIGIGAFSGTNVSFVLWNTSDSDSQPKTPRASQFSCSIKTENILFLSPSSN